MIRISSRNGFIYIYLHTLIDYPSRYNPYCINILTDKLKQDEEFMYDYLNDLFKYCSSSEEFYRLSALDDLRIPENCYVPLRGIGISFIINRTDKFIDLVYYYKGLKIL